MPKPMKVVAKTYAGEPGSCDSTEHVRLADALRYANELAAEKSKEETEALLSHLAAIGPEQRRRVLDARFSSIAVCDLMLGKAANPGVVTRAEFDALRNRFEGVFNGDYTIKHVADLNGDVQILLSRIKALEQEARSRGVMLP